VGVGVQGRSRAQLFEGRDSPGEYRIDVNGGYQAERWSMVIGVKNLTDQQLYTLSSRTGRLVSLLQPREFYNILRYRF
jgi:outer membrane receptor protein involved in Fe transport